MTDMTQAQTPEALCLADACLDDWDLVRPHLVVDMLRTQHAHIAQLEAELVKEAARTAAEKLRADQMTQRLDMVNRLGNDARAELAQLRQAGATAGNHIPDAGRMVPLTDAQCDKLIAALCPDFTDERFPRDRSIMRELARDAITPTA